AAAGDESATELVLELVHRLRLWRSAVLPIVSDPTTADDVAQATLVAIERKIGSYAGRSKFRTWLFAVARNEALMAVRPRKSDAQTVGEPPDASARYSSIIAVLGRLEVHVASRTVPF